MTLSEGLAPHGTRPGPRSVAATDRPATALLRAVTRQSGMPASRIPVISRS